METRYLQAGDDIEYVLTNFSCDMCGDKLSNHLICAIIPMQINVITGIK